jgi:N-acylneuraminate cytidylyltransferase
MDVLRHAVAAQAVPPDVLVLLQPTSPLRTADDITAAIRLMMASGAPACIGVTACKKPPHWIYRLGGDARLTPLLSEAERLNRRQDLEETFVGINGAVYVARTPWLLAHGGFMSAETVAYEMAAERSVDIDDHMDFKLAELLMADRRG